MIAAATEYSAQYLYFKMIRTSAGLKPFFLIWPTCKRHSPVSLVKPQMVLTLLAPRALIRCGEVKPGSA